MVHWSTFLGAFFQKSGLSDVLEWSSNGSGVSGQASTKLEITIHDWPVKLAIKLATICDI